MSTRFALALFAALLPAAAGAQGRLATAVFATGCFWSSEKAAEAIPGVTEAVSGYTGGTVANPTYEQVNTGRTGHFEAVRVTYDPAKIGYAALAERILLKADVTDGGGQFCDRGLEYRPAVFVANAAEREAATRVLQGLKTRYKLPAIAVAVKPAAPFYAAEGYHQDYAKKNPLRYEAYRIGCRRDAALKAVYAKG